LAEFDNTLALSLGRIGAINSNYNYTASGAVLPQKYGWGTAYRYYQTEVYVGDVWKVNRQLTLNYGLRYQYDSVPTSRQRGGSPQHRFDSYMATRVAQSAASKNATLLFPSSRITLAARSTWPQLLRPKREGLCSSRCLYLQPGLFPDAVINGGAGIVYDRTVVNAIQFIQNQASYLFQNSVATNYGDPSSPSNSLKNDPRYGTNFGFPAAPVAPLSASRIHPTSVPQEFLKD